MSDIQRLLRVAARRNEAGEYGSLRVRLLKTQIEALREQLLRDGASANVLFEAVLRGYLERHPAVLAMLDQWKRDEQPESQRSSKSLTNKEVADIYAEIGGGMVGDE
jgi:hypothetical protein